MLNKKLEKKDKNKKNSLKSHDSASKVVLATKSEIKAKRKELYEQEKAARVNKKRFLLKLIKILDKNCFKEEQAIGLVNYLCFKKLYPDEIIYIIESSIKVKKNQSKIISVIKPIFKKNNKELTKTKKLKELFSKAAAEDIINITKEIKNINEGKYIKKFVDCKIYNILENDGQPPAKLLTESIEQYCDLCVDNSTSKYYAKIKNKDEKKHLREINSHTIENYCNEAFGYNKINSDICSRVFKFITRDIEKDYSLLEFSNGSLKLNKKDYEFLKDEFFTDRIPKIVFPFEWNSENNEDNKIEDSIKNILKCDEEGFEDNINIWYRCIGNACMPTNENQIATILTGPQGTGKSTLLSILKRIFNSSEVSFQDIIANKRFTLYPTIDKDINIDDDIKSGAWRAIGKLKTFISGNGGYVEKKGENDGILFTPHNTPKLFGAANELPVVDDEGFERRLILIKAINKIPINTMDGKFQVDILEGFYDKYLGKIIYDAINLYYENKRKVISSEENKKAMFNEWKWKSEPLEMIIDNSFRSPTTEEMLLDEEYYIPVSEVNSRIKFYLNEAFHEKKIYSSQKNPSLRKIKAIMENKGFIQKKIAATNEYGDRTTINVYIDIIGK